MKINSINRSESCFVGHIPEPFDGFDSLFFEELLFEGQEDYLKKKYPEVSPDLIQQAIELDRKSAEKLVLGLKDGVIDTLDQDSVAAVADLDPFKKKSNKSEADLAYEAAIKKAKQIHPKYWQWILRQQKENPDVEFDDGIFHYFEGENLTDGELKEMSLDEARQKSQEWHEEQFANQKVGGDYILGPDSPEATKTGPFFWVPVTENDARIEGKKMQNCIGSFCKPSATTKIFSMRNKFNNPHVSMSILKERNAWSIREIKGKQNKSPPSNKYIPFVVEFCDKLIKKGVGIGPRSDFWRLPVDFDDYVKYYAGDVTQDVNVMNRIGDEALNHVIQRNGLSRSDETIVERLTPDTIKKLLESNPAAQGAYNWNASDFVMFAIKHRKLDENEARALAEQGKLPRGAQMTLLSSYHPEEFLETIVKIPVDDLVPAFENYKHAVEAYNGRHEVFGKIVDEMQERDILKVTIGKSLLPKVPVRQLIQMLPKLDYTKYDQGQQIDTIADSLSSELTSSDFETKHALISQFPNEYEFSESLADSIAYSTEFDNLRSLYQLGNASINKKIEYMLAGIREIEADIEYPQLGGSSKALISGADQVLRLDDPDELRALRKATKSRGIKKLVDRKLARLQRLENAAQ